MSGEERISEKLPGATKKELYEYWQDVLRDSKSEYQDLLQKLENHRVSTVNDNTTEDQMKLKQEKYLQSLLTQVKQILPSHHPELQCIDSSRNTLQELKNDISEMVQLIEQEPKEIDEMEKEIKHFKKQMDHFEQMKKSYPQSEEDSKAVLKTKYLHARTVFKAFKQNLVNVTDTIFPDNEGFEEFLRDITQAYAQGGDDMFIKILDHNVIFADFMVNADLAIFHNHEKTLLKLYPL